MKTNKLLRNKFCRFWAKWISSDWVRIYEKRMTQNLYLMELEKTMPKYETITIK